MADRERAALAKDSRAMELIERGDNLFSKRVTMMSFWDEIAQNFYPERADFLIQRVIGNHWADNLMTSYPLIARRELGNQIGAMLRPTAKEWFKMSVRRADKLDDAGRRWLAWANAIQRSAMYDRISQFHRATKEGDHDFAAFGQCVITCELNRAQDALLFRNWHLRDVAWTENCEGKIDTIHRKWKPAARDVMQMFPKTASVAIRDMADKHPHEEVEIRHVVMPAEDWQAFAKTGEKIRQPYVSVYVEATGDAVLEVAGSWNPKYIIPRWQTVSGSQYAYSAAVVAAIPDARLLQAMTLTLLEAGERFTNPPMIAVQEAIRSDIQAYAGGITWVDAEYDERLGEVLRPLTQDKTGMPIGRELRNDVKETLDQAFFLNKLTMPQLEGRSDMTAFEVGQRIQEYIRGALPLFEPMEQDYNGALCDIAFDVLMHGGAFGPRDQIPQSLHNQDVQFRFESPLSEAIDAQLATKLAQSKQMLAEVVDLDPTAVKILDAKQALRDALLGAGAPPRWLRSPAQLAQIAANDAAQAQQAQLLEAMGKSADIAKTVGDASQAFAGAGAQQQPAMAA
jgi:hypothetical protein